MLAALFQQYAQPGGGLGVTGLSGATPPAFRLGEVTALHQQPAQPGGGVGVAGLSGATPQHLRFLEFPALHQQHAQPGGGVRVAGVGGFSPPIGRLSQLTPPHQQHTEVERGLGVAGLRRSAPHGLRLIECAELHQLHTRLVRIVDRRGVERLGSRSALIFLLVYPLVDPLTQQLDGHAQQVSDAVDRVGLINALAAYLGHHPHGLPPEVVRVFLGRRHDLHSRRYTVPTLWAQSAQLLVIFSISASMSTTMPSPPSGTRSMVAWTN